MLRGGGIIGGGFDFAGFASEPAAEPLVAPSSGLQIRGADDINSNMGTRNIKILGLVLLALAIITAFVVQRQANLSLSAEVASLRSQSTQPAQSGEVAQLRSENERLAEQLKGLKVEGERSERELLQLRGQVAALRQAAKEHAAKTQAEAPLPLSAVSFSGNSIFTSAQLSNMLTSRIGEPVDQQKLWQDINAIYEAYRQAGHDFVSVDPMRDKDGSGLTYVIGEPGRDAVIGVEINYVKPMGALHIEQVLPNSPAEAAGLQRGLYIQEIDGKPVRDLTYGQCVGLLRGHAGSRVRLGLFDSAQQTQVTVEVARHKLVL